MTDLVYPGPLSAVILPDGTVCEKDSPVTVAAAYVDGLVEQGWFKPKSEKNGAAK